MTRVAHPEVPIVEVSALVEPGLSVEIEAHGFIPAVRTADARTS